ncbi:DUF305 domain-containing protein [Romeria aff. gracilis LEGE 07310]|uniref:DUF305 domain-containing protein n=1 Tax=Vasconcelosia minhoensis LEGE 07310 TaxID=915328 RepID=A0A8J7ASB4_9CYAN|nr:DUF305 domain-containing protein [Romeria gracilis]MBE9079786.1 DUF305 domain-containing protein [Romeria aff. gracilis LEGE 07310]
MHLKRPFVALLLGAIASGPLLLAGCSTFSQSPNGHSMPIGDSSMADHEMTMDLGPKDAEFDLRFIDGMILHHQGAIAMAEAVLQNSQRDEMRQLAQEVIAAQQSEIDQMQQWRQDWYPNASAEPVMYDAQMGHTMAMPPEMQTAMRMDGGLGKADAEFDRRFIDAMIPHHEGALTMAEQVLEKSARSELRQVAEDILATQQTEIDQMTQWRQDWYAQ